MSDAFVGEIRIVAFRRIPENWMQCNGQILNVPDYAPLYSLIGNTYGGTENTTFALPDLRGCVPVGRGQGTGLANDYPLGARFGMEQVALDAATIPNHNHIFNAVTSPATSLGPVPNGQMTLADVGAGNACYALNNAEGANFVEMNPQSIGSNLNVGQYHDNVMPCLAMYAIICVRGIYPTI